MLYISPLVHILNLSLKQGVFPSELKIARVIPIYKLGGDNMQINNYRPVSVLAFISKIVERIMYNRIIEYVNKHNILYKYQSGFREKHGTNTALIVLIDKTSTAINNGDRVLGVFLDFSKAFVTVDHSILLKKLYKYGIRGAAHKWVSRYLYGRQQFVSFNNKRSKTYSISCGVPQGSILGPLLFLLYVNDIAQVSSILFPIMYADDTNLFLQGKCLNTLIEKMNLELQKIVEWLKCNKLSLNIDKTHYSIFRSIRKCPVTTNHLKINNENLKHVKDTKFVGVIIDEHLNWASHIKTIKCKLARGIGMLCKARKVLKSSTLLPYICYCIEVWGSACDKYISSLFKIQKKSCQDY